MEKVHVKKSLRPPFPQVKKDPKFAKPKLQLARSDIAVHHGDITQEEIQKLFGPPLKLQKLDKLPCKVLRARRTRKKCVPPPPPQMIIHQENEGPICKKLKLSIPPSATSAAIKNQWGPGNKPKPCWVRRGPPPTKIQPAKKNSKNQPKLVTEKDGITIFQRRENEGDEMINWLKEQAAAKIIPKIEEEKKELIAKKLYLTKNETRDKGNTKEEGNKSCDEVKASGDNIIQISGDNCAIANNKTCDDDDEALDDDEATCQSDDPPTPPVWGYSRKVFSFRYLLPALFSIILVFKFGRK